MFKFTLVLLALVALHEASGSSVREHKPLFPLERHIQNRGLIDEAKKAFQKVLNAVTNAIDGQIKLVEDSKKAILEDIRVFADKAVVEASKVVDQGLEMINTAMQAVINVGLDPTACLGTVIDAINGLKDSYVKDIGRCVTDRIPDLEGLVDKAIEEIQGFNDEVKALGVELDNCNGGFICLTSFVAKCGLAAFEIPIKVVRLAATHIKQLGSISGASIKCVADNGSRLAKAIAANVDVTVKCLWNQIGQ